MYKCYVNVCGGVGNQLFQIANGYAYSRDNNKQLCIDVSGWSASQGRRPEEYASGIFQNFRYENATRLTQQLDEKSVRYEKLPVELADVTLNGYFQSLKYFESYVEDFKNLIVLSGGDVSFIREDDVAFHIRRGDYKNFPHIFDIGPNYFRDRFDEFKGRRINVFTDSPQIVLDEFAEFEFNLIQTSTEIGALTMISQHDNVVCSNSSFSWWGSLLGKKKKQIIVPDKWLNGQDCSDFYRDDMTIRPT